MAVHYVTGAAGAALHARQLKTLHNAKDRYNAAVARKPSKARAKDMDKELAIVLVALVVMSGGQRLQPTFAADGTIAALPSV